MSLRPETLHPLKLASFVLDYRLEGHPLQIVVKRFSYPGGNEPSSDSSQEVTLLLSAGIGCNCETWLPTIKRVFHLQTQSKNPAHIRHVWAVEWPNHGDAAILNEATLKEKYAESITPRDVGIALRHLVRSGLIDLTTSKLVGLSHSAGTGGQTFADPEMRPIPYDAVIIIEPPLFNRDVIPFQKIFNARSVALSKALPDVWPTLDEAISWHKGRAPWRTWDPEVLQVFLETNFRTLPTAYNPQTQGVTTKTYKGQIAASFNSVEEVHICVENTFRLSSSIPVHLVYGARKDFWSKELRDSVEQMTRANECRFASITVIPGAGHFVPQENPHSLAKLVLQIIRGMGLAAKL